MSARRLDGKREADRILRNLDTRVRRTRRPITLATILVGKRYDSALYVKLKRQAAARVGIQTEYHHLPTTTSPRRLEHLIRTLNRRRTINGILLQLPLPPHLKADAVIGIMDPQKDVDGFHPANHFVTPPPIAAVARLTKVGKPKPGAFVCIIAQPSVFAEQLAKYFEQQGFTAAVIGSVHQLRRLTTQADVVVSALGTGRQLTAATIKPGSIVVDVGIRKHGQKTIGDVHSSVWKKAKAISPVPGGVGPLTIAYVLQNTYQLTLRP